MPKEAAEKNIHVLERNGKLGEVKIADEVVAVSYTHLDVYKRQTISRFSIILPWQACTAWDCLIMRLLWDWMKMDSALR